MCGFAVARSTHCNESAPRFGSRTTRETSSASCPALPQGMPANHGTPERQKRLKCVGPLVVPHTQAAKLIQPVECALHGPAPPAQATPMLRAAHGKRQENVASSQTVTDERACNRVGCSR